MLDRPADNISKDTIPDGQAGTASYHAGSFSGSWHSMMEITVRTELAECTLDLTVTEQNTGQVPTPAGVGWHPVFALAGDRADVRIVIPSITKGDVDRGRKMPSGEDKPDGRA